MRSLNIGLTYRIDKLETCVKDWLPVFPVYSRFSFMLGCFQERNSVSPLVNKWRICLEAEEIQHHFLRQSGNVIVTKPMTELLPYDVLVFTSAWASGAFSISFRVTLKVYYRETGKCWGSGAMLDIFGSYSSTGREAAGLPFQLLSPPMLSFALSPGFVVFCRLIDASADGQWRIGWILVSRCLVCARLPLVGDDGTMTMIVAFTMNFRRSRTSITTYILEYWHEEAGAWTKSATFLIIVAT